MKEGFKGQRQVLLPQIAFEIINQDKRLSLLHVTALGYYPRAKYHKVTRPNGAEQFILIYCVDGAGWYVLDGHRYEVNTNEVFILPPNRSHGYGSDFNNPWTIYWIHFSGTVAEEYAKGFLVPRSIDPGIQSRITTRNKCFEEIFSIMEQGFELSNMQYASSLLPLYLGSFQNLLSFRNSVLPGDSWHQMLDITDGLIHYMEETINRKMTKQDFANYCGYSVSQMSHFFKEKTGYAPMAYFTMLKIKKACALLKSSNYKIGQICFLVGYSDQLYFSRVFAQYMGMSPTQYRNTAI
ncbi:MAG: AraC family transcriptional regulator [Bacteroidaceae bacterium]|nr:AraC family transcriptional regulator [Bacteroidaceae bacterium]